MLTLRERSQKFGINLKEKNLQVWENIGLALTKKDPNMNFIAKREFYRQVQMPSLDRDFTEKALTDMIQTYTNWERTTSLKNSIFLVSQRDIEWAILKDNQRRQWASQQARSWLDIDDEK